MADTYEYPTGVVASVKANFEAAETTLAVAAAETIVVEEVKAAAETAAAAQAAEDATTEAVITTLTTAVAVETVANADAKIEDAAKTAEAADTLTTAAAVVVVATATTGTTEETAAAFEAAVVVQQTANEATDSAVNEAVVASVQAVDTVDAVVNDPPASSPSFQYNAAFLDAGKQTGIEIWRIENFEPVLQNSRPVGEFYNGDAYIILKTAGVGASFVYDLHFWLGKKCDQDESGSAAIHTVELDEALGGKATQYREVQGHESKRFLSYFKKGIKYLEGGVKSGFTKVEHGKYVKRLFQCKGKHTVRVEEVEVKCGSLNQGDVFILDDGPALYVWIGPKASRMEKLKGMDIARGIRDDEKAGRARISVVDSDWNSNAAFYKALGSHDKAIKAAGDDDEEVIRKLDTELTLYQIGEPLSDSGSDVSIVQVATGGGFSAKLLDSKFCYVLESGASGIYVWTGKDCAYDFKKKVWSGVNAFVDRRGYPSWMHVARVVDGGETPLFKQYFSDWVEIGPVAPIPEHVSDSNVAGQSYEGVEGATLHGQRPPKGEDFLPDDGTGKLTVYRVGMDNELMFVPQHAHGIFFGGDCYVMQYDYKLNGRDAHIIYFWQGLEADINERGASALQAMNLDDQLGGEAVQIRVVMNKEPAHFMKIFGGRLVIFRDGHINGFQGIKDHDFYDPNEPLMFHIHGDDESQVRAIQVDCRGSSLNSNDIFIIDTPKKVYVWVGKQSAGPEADMARLMVQHLAPGRDDPAIVEEGHESRSFWDAIGGEEEYYKGIKRTGRFITPVRLYQCSNASGRFVVDEIVDFNQQDLDEDDVMMLDTCDEIIVWIGKGANDFEKKESMKTAYSYLKSDPTGRTEDNTTIFVVRQGFEPPQFTGHFHPWDSELWNEGKTYAEKLAELNEENAGVATLEEEAAKYFATYPIEVLRRKIPPEGVDVTKKELYLSDEDFFVTFGMTKDEYLQNPEWKRLMMRKSNGLF